VHQLIAAFVDELARAGVSDACTSPGSRSTPLVLALAREPRLRAHSLIDERASGFFALGAAKASGRPVAVACTSGTAVANLLPAVIEASEAGVPLIVLSADRPPELRGVGAGQTIDQIKIFGDAVRWFVEVGHHDEHDERWIRALAARACAVACDARAPGPVHLNWPLREPLVPDGPVAPPSPGRAGGRPWTAVTAPEPAPFALGRLVPGSARGVVVAGRDDRAPAPQIPALAADAGYPLLADPLSGARSGPAAIAHYDLLLREDPDVEVVIRVGDLPTSKPLREWLARHADARQILVDPRGGWQDPASVVETVLRAEPRALRAPPPADAAWLSAWREADARAAAAIDALLGEELSEPNVARALAETLGPEATLLVAASMPVRELESFWPVLAAPPRVLANRGANGIDGTLATAFGIAAASRGPVYALLGDVAFAHDLGGLLAGARLGVALTIVLIDNGGGAIFDRLAIASQTDVYERHVATPTGLDFERAAALAGFAYARPDTLAQLRAALERPGLVHVRTDRADELALAQRVTSIRVGAPRA
jgi:2-succinyl-5-enolpyruvyl-6-hydroxy-3-cyclohexene-1-carboxylate synthase